jgi:hypothetical protein
MVWLRYEGASVQWVGWVGLALLLLLQLAPRRLVLQQPLWLASLQWQWPKWPFASRGTSRRLEFRAQWAAGPLRFGKLCSVVRFVTC